jgi:predicted dehydrogenase
MTASEPSKTAWSRRDLVRSGAAALALPLVAASCASTASRTRTPFAPRVDKRLKIGLVGCGGRGTGAAVQALRADPNTVLWAMSDVFGDRMESSLQGVASELGAEAAARVQVPAERRYLGFDSYHQVMDDPEVDVVILTSYPHFRPAQLAAAVAAGKHVFAEKPLAVDGPGVRSVLASAELAKQKRLACLIGFCWRHHDGMRATFDALHDGVIGDVESVHTTYHTSTLSRRPRQSGWSDVEFQMRNWWHFCWISGDHIVEQAVHSIDRLAWAMGDVWPTRVTCLGGRAARNGPEHGDVYDHFAAIYEYADGRRGFHTCTQIDGTPSDNTDYVTGTQGRASINGWNPESFVFLDRKGAERWRYKGENRDMYQNEHDELFASIRGGYPINDCVQGAHSTLMAIMARMAAYSGQVVTWEQALQSQEVLGPSRYALESLPVRDVPIPGKTPLA